MKRRQAELLGTTAAASPLMQWLRGVRKGSGSDAAERGVGGKGKSTIAEVGA